MSLKKNSNKIITYAKNLRCDWLTACHINSRLDCGNGRDDSLGQMIRYNKWRGRSNSLYLVPFNFTTVICWNFDTGKDCHLCNGIFRWTARTLLRLGSYPGWSEFSLKPQISLGILPRHTCSFLGLVMSKLTCPFVYLKSLFQVYSIGAKIENYLQVL